MAFGGSGFGGSGFGGSAFSSSPFGASSSVFGVSSSAFGAQSQGGLFGGTPGSSSFGASSAFGSSAPAFGTGGAPFGAAAAPFGASSTPFGGNSAPAFGTGTGGGGFGQPAFGQSAPNLATGTSWPAQQPQDPSLPPSTRTAKWNISQLNESGIVSTDGGRYLAVSLMEPYRGFSFEELRFGDYSRNDKGGENMSSAPSVFGANPGFGGVGTAQPQSTGLFGSSTPAFGASSQPAPSFGGFNASSASLFGAPTQQQQSSSLFGSSAFGNAATASSSAFGGFSAPAFGSQLSSGFSVASASAFGASSSVFGQSQPASAFGSFGASTQSLGDPPSSQSTSLFGAPAASSSNLFGSQSGSGFGLVSSNAAPAPAFGTPFPSQTAQSAPSLFGTPAPGVNFGQPPASSSSIFASAFGASGASTSLFAPASSASIFASASSSSLFASSSLFSSSSSLFPAPASSASLFGTSLFSSSQPGAINTGSSSLFSYSSGAGLFPQSGQQLNFAQPQQVQQSHNSNQPIIQLSLTQNPFGESRLIAGASTAALATSSSTLAKAETTPVAESGPLTVVVANSSQTHGDGDTARRPRGAELLSRQSALLRRSDAPGWFAASPMRPWGRDGPLFNSGSVLRGSGALTNRSGLHLLTHAHGSSLPVAGGFPAPWRTEEQILRAANIKKLVIEPASDGDNDDSADSSDRERNNDVAGTPGHYPEETIDRSKGRDISSKKFPNPANLIERRSFRRDLEGNDDGRGQHGEQREYSNKQNSNDNDPAGQANSPREGRNFQVTNQKAPNGGDVQTEKLSRRLNRPREDDEKSATNKGSEEPLNVPYNDLYRTPLAAGRRASSGEKARLGNSSQSQAPISTVLDSYTIPSLSDLRGMTDSQLSNIASFTYGLKGLGEVTWLEAVDVRGLNLDKIIKIVPREVCVYPDEKEVPPVGDGLNKPARIKLHGIWKFNRKTKTPLKNAAATAAIVSRLKQHCDSEGLTFLGYDVRTGTWTFRAEHF